MMNCVMCCDLQFVLVEQLNTLDGSDLVNRKRSDQNAFSLTANDPLNCLHINF